MYFGEMKIIYLYTFLKTIIEKSNHRLSYLEISVDT